MNQVEQKVPLTAITEQKDLKNVQTKIVMEDVSLINELNFCFQATQLNEDAPEQQAVVKDNSVLIRGCNNSTVNRVNAKLNFEFEE